MRITKVRLRSVIRKIIKENMETGRSPKFQVGDIVTDQWGDFVGRIVSLRWHVQFEEFQYELRSVPPYPWVKKIGPKSALESHLQLFDKPADFDENVRQERLHPTLRGWPSYEDIN